MTLGNAMAKEERHNAIRRGGGERKLYLIYEEPLLLHSYETCLKTFSPTEGFLNTGTSTIA